MKGCDIYAIKIKLYGIKKNNLRLAKMIKTYSSIPIIELQQYKKKTPFEETKKSEEDYKEGRIYSAEEVFKELRREFKY